MRRILSTSAVLLACLVARADQPVKKIVLVAGKKSHGPGVHEYEKDVKLLKHCLDTSPNVKGIKTESHFGGWPQDPRTFDDADTIVLLSDGLDKQYPLEQHPFLKGDHMQVIERQVKRGCGLVLIHWPLWVPSRVGQEKFMPWLGGFCDYQNRPGPGMSDKVDWSKQAAHPICRGLKPLYVPGRVLRQRPIPGRRSPFHADSAFPRPAEAGRLGLGVATQRRRPFVRLHRRALPQELADRRPPQDDPQRHCLDCPCRAAGRWREVIPAGRVVEDRDDSPKEPTVAEERRSQAGHGANAGRGRSAARESGPGRGDDRSGGPGRLPDRGLA